jgi:hypothetical protein
MNKNRFVFLFAAIFCLTFTLFAAAQDADKSNIVKVNLSQSEIDKIVAAFAAKEREYRQALNQYGFKREVIIQSIGFGGNITGEYRRDSNFTFGDDGKRYEKVLFAPMPTLKDITMTAEDLQDLNGVNQFALEPEKLPMYTFNLVGKEKIDELNLYVFDVAPRLVPDIKKTKERYFLGRIWVDDRDLQIVKSKGKGVPEDKDNKFPVVEIWRENIDGKYWFPTYSYANDKLYFEKSGQTAHIKMKIIFSNYKKGRTEVRILDEDETVNESKPPQTNPKKPN